MSTKPLTLILMALVLLSSTVVFTAEETGAGDLAEWTFIVYLDADNNLEGAGVEDLNEMELSGSTEDVNIVAIMDRGAPEDLGSDDYTGEGDWTGLRIYNVQQDNNPDSFAEYTEGVNVWYSDEDIEPNMGDPNQLANYTTWVMDQFPAKRYMLDFWNHGGAWWGICWDDSHDGGDRLNMSELSQGLGDITTHLGRKIDLIGFDACLMADMAVQYEIRDYCEVSVASGFNEPGDGWPYETILPALTAEPQMGPEDLAGTIVTEYIESYTNQEQDPQDAPRVSMSAFDMSKLENAVEAINEFGMAMAIGPPPTKLVPGYFLHLDKIRSATAAYDTVNLGPIDFTRYCEYDVKDFASRVERDTRLDFLHPYAQKVIHAVDDCIIKARLSPLAVKHQGVSVYFPSGTQTVYDARFDDTKMGAEKYWDEFLNFYARSEFALDTPPSVAITNPQGSESYSPDVGKISIKGTAFDLQNTLVSVEIKIGEDGEWQSVNGREFWTYDLNMDGSTDDVVVYVRAFDGQEYSGEVSRCFMIVEDEGPPAVVSHEGLGGWSFLAIPLVAIVGFIIWKKGLLSRS